jgi:hypothetical protein
MDYVDVPIIILLIAAVFCAIWLMRDSRKGNRSIVKSTKGSIIHRGHTIDFKTKERDGLWQCSACCNSHKGSFGLTVFEPVSLRGFASKGDAEKATLDAMKNWIDETSPL